MSIEQAKTYYIYQLNDPRTNLPSYVGFSQRPERRLQEHIQHPGQGIKEWIDELKHINLLPTLTILETVHGTIEDATNREVYWVQHLFNKKMPLKNYLNEYLLDESRNQCTICGSTFKANLQIAHITALFLGGKSTFDNLIILCATCHTAIDSFNISAQLLHEIKKDWIEKRLLGRGRIVDLATSFPINESLQIESITKSFLQWVDALKRQMTFDEAFVRAKSRITSAKNEDEFIHDILKPIFDFLGFEGITILHHSGQLERGKDMVFYQKDSIGSFTVYAVVACNAAIHANSSKTSSSGHYDKIIDQVKKCYRFPWKDHNTKRETYVDKIIIATPYKISEEAVDYFSDWEKANKRQLIYLDGDGIAGMFVKLLIK